MTAPVLRVAACALAVAVIGACDCGGGAAQLAMPKKLRVGDLAPAQKELLRANLEIGGLLAPTDLTFDDDHTHVSGSFVVSVDQSTEAPITLRVFGRLSSTSEEVLLGIARKTVTVEPRASAIFDLAEDDWSVDGAAVFDDNGNAASNIDDLVAGFDPAAPERVLAVLPDTLQFPSGIRPGQFTRQVIVVENVSGLTQTVTPSVVGGQGVSITRIDPTGAPEGGAPRALEPFDMQPFQEILLAVTFAPTNEFLVRGSVALATVQPQSHVTGVNELPVIANSDGDPQSAAAGYDPGTVDGAALGYSGSVIPFPPASLFGGQPISPGEVQLSNDPADVVTVPSLGFAGTVAADGFDNGKPGEKIGGLPPSLVFNVVIPPKNRLSVVLDGLSDDVQLGLFVLDDTGHVGDVDGESVISAHAGKSPEAAQFRNASADQERKAVIVLSLVDVREPGDAAPGAGVPFALLAQLNAGPEFADVDPLSRTHGDFRGGNDVSLHGVDFKDGATVLVGDHAASRLATTTNADGTVIDTVTPRGSEADLGNALTVVAINPDGEAATLPSVFFYDAPAPEIDDVDPPTGSTLGGTALLVSGASFTAAHGGPRVLVGGVPASDVVVLSSNALTCTAPAGSAGFTTLVVENLNDDGSAVASAGFPFVYVEPAGDPPQITSIDPATGATEGNDLVTLHGAGFAVGADVGVNVRFGGSVASDIEVVDDATITCRTPARVDPGAVDVFVTNPDGQSAVALRAFEYVTLPPVLLVAVPGTVSTGGGTRVFVDGTGFRADSTAVFSQSPPVVAATTSLAAPNVTFVNTTRLVITTPGGLAAGAASLVVQNADGQASAPLPLDVQAPQQAPPRILALNPSAVRVDALTTVTVTGTGFATGSGGGAMIAFLDTDPLAISQVTATSFTFEPPAHQAGSAGILRVINPDGQTDSSALFYEEALGPVMNSVSPGVVGALVPGDVVTVGGQNFGNITDANVHLLDHDGLAGATEYAATLVAASATTLRVRIDDELPERGDFVIAADFENGGAISPSFAALGPSLLSQQALAPPVDGQSFTVLLQGSSLNHAHINAVRFVREDDALTVEITPTIATDSLIRVDSGGRIAQGSWSIFLVYTFVNAAGANDELAIFVPNGSAQPAPAPFVVSGQCGNGVLDAGEDCDAGGVFAAGLSCTGFGFFGGTLLCDGNCHARTTQCTRCGDNIIDAADFEQCDGSNVGGATCEQLVPGSTGTVACTSQCQLSANGCSICGNGVVEGDEECDGNNLNGATCSVLGFNAGQLTCDPETCRFSGDLCSTCGNNRCDTLETSANCAADCPATCGNNVCDGTESCSTCPKDCGGQCTGPFSLQLVSGGGQSARFSADLAQPFVVRAQDAGGAPLVGLQLVFTAPNGGVAAPASVLTDASGNASSLAALPRALGAQPFSVTGTGPDGQLLAGAPLTIAATATDIGTNVITSIANQPGVQNRASLLDGQGNPAPVAASKAPFNFDGAGSSGVVVRPSDGSIFISDTNNNRVVRIAPDGRLFLAAGSNAGTAGFVDNVTAINALFSRPRGLALDAQENLYIADSVNNRIRKLDKVTNNVTTFAGGGASTNEGVIATTAQLFNPESIVFAPNGDAFVLNDGTTDSIRKISAGTTFINTVVAMSSCSTTVRVASLDGTEMAIDPQGRLVFIGFISNAGGCPVPPNTDHILRLEDDGSLTSLAGGGTTVVTGAARGAALQNPTGLVMDGAGNAYVTERSSSSRRLRKVSALGVISTFAGTTGVAAGVTTTGDGGPASGALFNVPGFLAFGATGDLVVTDAGLDDVRLIRSVAENTPPVVTAVPFGGGQSATIAQALAQPLGVTVSDAQGNRISSVFVNVTVPEGAAAEPSSGFTDGNGVFSFVAFVGRAPGPYAFTLRATGLDGLPLGAPIVLTETANDTANNVVTSIVNQVGTAGSGLSSAAARSQVNLTTAMNGIAIDPDDGTLFYSDTNNHRVMKVTPQGAVSVVAGTGTCGNGGNGPALSVQLCIPRGVALDADKNLYIADSNNDVVRVLKDQGTPQASLTIFAGSALNQTQPNDGVVATGANLDNPTFVIVGPTAADGSPIANVTDNVFILDENHNRIRRVPPDATLGLGTPGVISSIVTGSACSSATGPHVTSFTTGAIAFDKAGRLYFGGAVGNSGGCPLPDPNGEYIFRLEDDGVTETALAGGTVDAAAGAAFGIRVRRVAGLAVDDAGNLYFVENTGHRIRRIDALGNMITLAGDGTAGFTSDNALASATRLNFASALAFDSADNLYFSDGSNQRIRMIRNIGQHVAATATISIVDGDAQTGTIGQLAPLPIRARVVDGGGAPVVNLPVFFTALDLGDTVTQPVVSTTIAGDASSTLRLGRSSTTPHRIQALARTWLDPVDIVNAAGDPVVFTLTAQRPASGSTVAIVNSQGSPGAVPALGGFGEIAATEARMSLGVSGVAIAPDGTLFVADTNNHRVLSVSPEGHLSVFAGTGVSGFLDNVPAGQALLETPRGVALDAAGNLYIADAGSAATRDRVRKVNIADGVISTIAGGAVDVPGHGDGGSGSGVSFSDVRSLAVGPDGFIYVVDAGFDNVWRIDPASPFSSTRFVVDGGSCNSSTGVKQNDLANTGLAWDSANPATARMYFVASTSNGGGCPVPSQVLNASAVLFRRELDGTLTYIAGNATSNATTTADGQAGAGIFLTNIGGLAIDAGGNLLYTEVGSHRLRRLGGVTAVPAGGGTGAAGTSGTVTTLAGTLGSAGFSSLTAPGAGLLNGPSGLVLDGASGDIYWTEDGSDSLRLRIP